MSRDRLLKILALFVVLVALLHFSATILSLYWRLWWFDMPVHFLGGAFIALSIVWLHSFSGYIPGHITRILPLTFAVVILGTIAVGIGWEIFERLLGHTWSIEGYWIDTLTDILMDFLGGIVAYLRTYAIGVIPVKACPREGGDGNPEPH